jgi:hypothetical protein
LNNTTGSVSLDEGVRSLDDISITALLLLLVVSGKSISYGVCVVVLWVCVVLSGDNSLSESGCSVGERSVSDGGGIGSGCIGTGKRSGIGSWCIGSTSVSQSWGGNSWGIRVCVGYRWSGISASQGCGVSQRRYDTSTGGGDEGGESEDLVTNKYIHK